MARAKTQKAAETKIPEGTPPGHALTVAETELGAKFQKMQDGYTEERDLVNRLLGRAQMANAIGKFADVVSLAQLKHIKENKLYRSLAGTKGVDPEGNEIADVGTWDGFLQVAGFSRSKVDEDLLNLGVFGEEALQKLSGAGAGYRELRKLRKLPDDIRDEIVQGRLVNLTDKEEVVALIDELAASHTKESDALKQQVTTLQEDAEAMDKVIGDKNKKLDQLEKEIKKSATQPWDAQVPKLNEEINMIFDVMMECADKLLHVKDVVLQSQFENDRDEQATKMLALNYFDRTQRVVEAIGLIQQVAFEDFDCYINAPKRQLITDENAG